MHISANIVGSRVSNLMLSERRDAMLDSKWLISNCPDHAARDTEVSVRSLRKSHLLHHHPQDRIYLAGHDRRSRLDRGQPNFTDPRAGVR